MSNFDPCECIWNHEHAMQRLMNMLRNSQDACTDTQCFDSLPGPQGSPESGMSTMFMFMMGWLVLATALFLLRPRALRNRGDQKPNPDNNQGNNPPPAPPVA